MPVVPPWLHVPPAGVELQPTMNAAQPVRISEYKRIFMAFLFKGELWPTNAVGLKSVVCRAVVPPNTRGIVARLQGKPTLLTQFLG